MVIGNRARPRYVAATRVTTASPTVETSRPTYATTSARVAANRDEQRVFELINAQRRARGEQPLAWDAGLMEIARLHAQNMARQDFFDHTGRDGRTAAERAAAAGIGGWRALGENIAYNQGFDDPAGFVVERWMTSSKHRDNILNGGFTHTGLGVARAADGRIFFTQVFMTR
jgi:uncharacterized protein YkwD